MPLNSTSIPELKEKIQELLIKLPPQDQTQPVLSEVEFYGATQIIAESIGLNKRPRSQATWSHGYHRKETLAVYISHEQRKEQVNLVRCERHAEILQEAGFPYALAVGLPYLYALKHPTSKPQRVPGSLLIMPAHTLTNLKKNADEKSYLKGLGELRHHFSSVVACLHGDCIKNGFWYERLEEMGIPWVIGASNQDSNALRRMHTLFSSFEFMTSNAPGSHIHYAAATGCKVSIFGNLFTQVQRETMLQNPFYQKHPEAVEYNLKYSTPQHTRKRFAQFFTEPQNAVDLTHWGLEAIGQPVQRPPEEIARLLGWQWSENASFQNTDFKQLAPILGFNPNHENALEKSTQELIELKGRNAWLEEQRKELKLAAKQNAKLAKRTEQKLKRSQADYQKIRHSIAWKLARPFHSIEKRLRKI